MEKRGDTGDIQGPGTSQVQQQQQQQTTQGTMVCWERFLHVRSIRVLLVEFDVCTRHVVTALLRNCNYEVLDAANGVQAWKILEDLANHIDIVLTEVVMPFLSGLGLLHKIMSHKTRKNIPVIMMSSHDSMGLVFKCLSKGAVDFLVKPIRKNELKNLWQHVWRRCQSSSGSGSGSGTQTQKSVKSRGSERSGNSSSSGGENDGCNGPNTGDGSDNGSGTQSYWTKQAAEVDSSQAVSPMDHVTVSPDSACAQVIQSNAESSEKAKIKASAAREGSGQNQPDTIAARSVQFRSEDHAGWQLIVTTRKSDSTTEMTSRINTRHNTNNDCKEPNLELSLKRPRGVLDTDRTDQEDRFVLRRSEQSAFSRYNTSTNVFKDPNGGTGGSSMVDNNVEAVKRESLKKLELDASHCGSINVVGQMDRDPRNNSLNKSASGSNYGSNGPNGSGPAANTAGNNAEGDVGQAEKSRNGDASGGGTAARAAENKLAQREAALIKFRQKRKERCFKKKVRYQNRKKLAEQRPRVRGQFVKQPGTDSSNGTGDE